MKPIADCAILIVDDSETMNRIMRRMLTSIGFSVIDEASNGRQAIDMLEQRKYDLVISDWNMDKMDGGELLGAIRSDPRLAGMPVLMVTADPDGRKCARSVALGAAAFLPKPFNAHRLQEVLGGLGNV